MRCRQQAQRSHGTTVFLLPEGNGRYPAHEGVGSDALQVEQGPVEKQQQDDVLAEAEAPPTLPDDGDVLETVEMWHKQPNKNVIDLRSRASDLSASVSYRVLPA